MVAGVTLVAVIAGVESVAVVVAGVALAAVVVGVTLAAVVVVSRSLSTISADVVDVSVDVVVEAGVAADEICC